MRIAFSSQVPQSRSRSSRDRRYFRSRITGENYRLIYELRDSEIVVLAFVHGARRFPGDL
ncbi:MAG: type II toxin-antitoxin system RelE/ParE family toxin [Bryobacteraceae bacterium]